jgi:diguanylate cyclase (GGDEF)-like protein
MSVNNSQRDEIHSVKLNRYIITVAVVWTLVMVASLAWNLVQVKSNTLKIALDQVRVSSEKDIMYRHWNAGHGGVYVPVTEETPPNTYLSHIPDRDITLPSGKVLTLVNPAYMTRQVNELAKKEKSSALTRITSLNPINPTNAPDPWETKALQALKRGEKEVTSIEDKDGKKYMRLMRPFITEKRCLKCHGIQRIKEGEIRGGISVLLPMDSLLSIERRRLWELSLIHGLLWLIVMSGIVLAGHRLSMSERERNQAEEALRTLSLIDELTGLHNRRGFFALAEQQLKIANRMKKEMLLIFADLDHLKWINDTLGHHEGDLALIEAAGILKETFRTSDIIARIGGDEFVITTEAVETSVNVLITRLLENLDSHNAKGDRRYKLSLSTGITRYEPENPCSIDELLRRADALMYEAKRKKIKN